MSKVTRPNTPDDYNGWGSEEDKKRLKEFFASEEWKGMIQKSMKEASELIERLDKQTRVNPINLFKQITF